MDRGAWWDPWGCKELDMTEQLTYTFVNSIDLMLSVLSTIIFLKEELKTEVQLGKFENQIDYLEQFMNWVASPLANRKKL